MTKKIVVISFFSFACLIGAESASKRFYLEGFEKTQVNKKVLLQQYLLHLNKEYSLKLDIVNGDVIVNTSILGDVDRDNYFDLYGYAYPECRNLSGGYEH